MTLKPRCESVETKKGVPLTVTGVAQVKVMHDPTNGKTSELLQRACEHFIGRSEHEIEEILSFVIQDLRDDVEYLTSIGKSRTAEVVKDANIGTTNAERDARIQEAICDQERNDAKMKADTNVDNAKRTFETTQAECETKI